MNVLLLQPRLRVLLFPLLIAFGTPRFVSAQSGAFKNLTTSINTEVSDTLSGASLFVYKANPSAKHGKMQIHLLQSGGAGSPNVYRISYLPGTDFVGVDTFVVQLSYLNAWPFLVYQAYRVEVYPSVLNARPDYAITAINTPVTLDVLQNDTGESPLTVMAIPLLNNGTVSVGNNNEVTFTPTPGFVGVAHINYVVCDAVNHCKTTYASIGVHGNGAPASDTLSVAAAKNTALSIPLTYNGYTLFQTPANGNVVIENGVSFRYLPNANFTGVDQFVLTNNWQGANTYKTVVVKVLDTPHQNKMAMDDVAYTPQGQPITFNVRDNDIGNLTVKSWVTPQGFPGALSNTTAAGDVTFTPNPDFTGVATFNYRIGNQQIPNLEMAEVNVVVGNMAPASSEYQLTTPIETPFVFNYKIPFTGFDFSVLNSPENGTCDYFPGYSTQTINGQTISGYNLLVYSPHDGFVGTDEFELSYCVNSNGHCQNVLVTMNVVDDLSTDAPYCVDDCVWAGDINNDGIVDNKDVLLLGHYIGLEGLQRPDAAPEWYGQFGSNWNNPYTGNPVDVKHADTDGNGVINHGDTLTLGLFYGLTNNLIPQTAPLSKSSPFFFNVLNPNPEIGDLVQVEVLLGNVENPMTDLYGFTFDVSLSPNIVDSAFRMTYYDNTWLNLNAPSLWMEKNPRQGRLESAFTRTGGVSANGYGVIGQFEFIIIDIVHGGKPGKSKELMMNPSFSITVDNPTVLSGSGNLVSAGNYSIEIPIGSRQRSQEYTVSDSDFLLYPSPANDRLRVRLNGGERIEAVAIFDATGRQVYHAGDVLQSYTELNIANLTPGFYVASARTDSGVVMRKFQIVR